MFAKLREKLHVFWMEHKYQIIGGGILAMGIAGACAAAGYSAHKEEERQAQQAEAQAAWDAAKAKLAEEEKNEVKAEDNPANQIASGGYFENWNDDLSDEKYPNILVNKVPVSSMGEFGQNILNKLNEEYFGEFNDEEHAFKPETATADVMVDFGHEVWKFRNQHEEKAE